MSGNGAVTFLVVTAIAVPIPVLGAISWWFWKHRHDE